MQKLIFVLFLFSLNAALGQASIPTGYLMKDQVDSVNEEISVTYAVDYELVKDLFARAKIEPRFLNKSKYSAFLDSTKTYVAAGFLIVYCEKCKMDDQKYSFKASSWLLTSSQNLNSHPKALGKYSSLRTGYWFDNPAVVKSANNKQIGLQKATFRRSEITKNQVKYKFECESFQMDMSFTKDSISTDDGNKGLFQTVWDSDLDHFSVFYSERQHERIVTNLTVSIQTKDNRLSLLDRPVYSRVVDSWISIAGIYSK